MPGAFQSVFRRPPTRSTVFGPSSAALGYLSRLAALDQARATTPLQQKILAVFRQYEHDPEVPIYVVEVVMRHFRGTEGARHAVSVQGEPTYPYIYPLDTWLRDLTALEHEDHQDERAAHGLMEPRAGRDVLRSRIISGDYYSDGMMRDLPANPVEGSMVPWIAREIGRMLKVVRRGGVVPVRAGAIEERHRDVVLYEVEHLRLKKERRRVDDATAAVRQNMYDMISMLRMVRDWQTQTGADAMLFEILFDADTMARLAMPVRRQSVADWSSVPLGMREDNVERGQAPSWGVSTELTAYSWVEAATAAEEWHKEIARRATAYFGVDAAEARMQHPGRVLGHDEETGWLIEDLDTKELLAKEYIVLRHCIEKGGYWEKMQRGEGRNFSIRSPVPSGGYRPRWTVEFEAGGADGDHWRIVQIKGFGNANPPWRTPEEEAARPDVLDDDDRVETCRQIARLLDPISTTYRTAHDWQTCAGVLARADAREAARQAAAGGTRRRRGGGDDAGGVAGWGPGWAV